MRSDIVTQLLLAKKYSDVKAYGEKHRILQRLLKQSGGDFVIDSSQGKFVGLTHRPSNFRIHMPRRKLPDNFLAALANPGQAKEAAYERSDRDNWPVAEMVAEYVRNYGDDIQRLRHAVKDVDGRVYYRPDTGDIWSSKPCPGLEKEAGLIVGKEDEYPPGWGVDGWVLVKAGYSPFLRGVSDVLHLTPGPSNQMTGGPRPISAMLAGGLLGAGLGWGGGALAEGLTGDMFEKGRLRRLATILGGMAGAVPGAIWAHHNVSRQGLPGLFSSTIAGPHAPTTQPDNDPPEIELRKDEDEGGGSVAPPSPMRKPASVRELVDLFKQAMPELAESASATGLTKVAAMFAGAGGVPDGLGAIPVDEFNNVLWSPYDQFTPMPLRAATSGVIQGAQALAGNSPIVGVHDITRLAVGMGSGYAAGTTAGTVLGALAGLSPEAQRALQQGGTWYGALKAVVPSLFGR